MEMREVLSREGREAKNLLVYQFCDETTTHNNDTSGGRGAGTGGGVVIDGSVVVNGDCYPTPSCRKPPVAPPKSPNGGQQTPKHCQSPTAKSSNNAGGVASNSGPRVRSASTGRDKKSELQARYWALLFGNLQRAVNEIYQTVECYENISSCQEAILVLENYVRDFKALSEWFKVSWDYDSRPLQQRPQSLAWEVRKSNPTPRVRTKSLCSPTASGKSSPALFACNSGKTSPCCDGHVSPKKLLRAYDQLPRGAMRVNVRELFAASKRATQGGGGGGANSNSDTSLNANPLEQAPDLSASDKSYVQLNTQYSQTDLEDPHLTLADVREKMRREAAEREAIEREAAEREAAEREAAEREEAEREAAAAAAEAQQVETAAKEAVESEQVPQTDSPAVEQPQSKSAVESVAIVEPTALQMTVCRMDAMENLLLQAQANKEPTPPSTLLKPVAPLPENPAKKAQPLNALSGAANAMQNSPLKYSSVLNRPAAARGSNPKTQSTQQVAAATAPTTAAKLGTTAKTATLPKTAVNGLRRSNNNNVNANVNSNTNLKPFGARTARSTVLSAPTVPPRPSSKTECYGPPSNVASRLSARSRTMIDMNGNSAPAAGAAAAAPKPLAKRTRSTLLTTTTTTAGTAGTTVGKRVSLPSVRLSSREDIASSTSTLKASNEQLSSSRSTIKLDDRHSEPKQLQLQLHDANDGWLTVKNRRRSSMHWANRFNQPTGYASLPTLALLNEQKEEKDKQQREKAKTAANAKPAVAGKAPAAKGAANKAGNKIVAPPAPRPEIKNAKAKVNSFPALRAAAQVKKQDKTSEKDKEKDKENKDAEKDKDKEKEKEKHADKEKEKLKEKEKQKPATTTAFSRSSSNCGSNVSSALNGRTSIIKRQKSDLTGLKMTSLHKEYMRSEKNALRKQQKEQKEQSSHDNSGSSGSTCESNNDDHNKIDIKIQTNCEFSKTIGELYESIARSKLPNGCVKSGASLLSACDENDEQSAEDVEEERNERMLVEVQESLERQIRELESTEIDVDTETDETDCEVQLEENEDSAELGLDDAGVFITMCDDENASLELRYQALLSDMSWNERAEALATLQAYVARHPGRAQELHQKLSSPSRRRSLQETLKKYQAKQARAQQKRALLQQEKAAKLQQLFVRVEDVKTAKKQLIEDKRQKMEGRLQRAAENREIYLRQIIEKAHDEEKKLKEINFIKNIEAQNKRLDLLESSKETEGRLQDLEQERQKRVEEKAAKEAAVERRRQALEKERLLKLEKMNETRLEKEQRIGKMQEQKERQRQALAREKARDREERLLALQVQQQQTAEELQRKIQQKQLESARRHEENIEHIRQRALELTMPSTRQQDEARGEQDDEEELFNGNATSTTNEDCDLSSTLSELGGVNGNREHSRSYKKKMKKLKQRMSQCASEYLATLEALPPHLKRDSSVPKLLNLVVKGGGAQGLDRTLGNLLRLIPKAQTCDFQTFLHMDGLGVLATHVISKGLEENTEISKKSLTLAVQLYRNACSVCPQIARHALLGNSIATLFDAISKSFQLPEEKSPQHPVELSTELMLACTEALSSSYVKKNTHPKVPERLPDMINYAVITGLIGMLSRRCTKVRESIEQNQSVMLSLLTTLGFLTRFIDACPPGPADPTRLLSTAKSTELFGTVSMLAGCVVPIGECIPSRTTALAASTFNLYVSLASVDVNTFQEVLSVEGPLSLKLLDVMTILLNYSVGQTNDAKSGERSTMLIDLIASIAFFSINNRRHQDLLISEQFAVIFKSLAKLPTEFHPVIYPFLVTICYNNAPARQVISRDFDLGFLDEYSKSDAAKRNRLIQMMHNNNSGNSSSNNKNNGNKNNNGNNQQQQPQNKA
ncbi:S phase cyclin A-associated protein in the endoplasmic reticulum isoform X2 [Drosophila sulfurigaster albostrigata]|uniref:S phase cyclin A-associated protein in the endoplasmic reticulum isoform X2 n=1 Tax=Drosophila sulfurigaster albostrigata TaxID=89887 RepID=UPI002D21D3A6|nr:S phase cyclin A-associated protein in the endoplasmic reticulum isoform X2 [Drosophila sulfurigaster albostrigata]